MVQGGDILPRVPLVWQVRVPPVPPRSHPKLNIAPSAAGGAGTASWLHWVHGAAPNRHELVELLTQLEASWGKGILVPLESSCSCPWCSSAEGTAGTPVLPHGSSFLPPGSSPAAPRGAGSPLGFLKVDKVCSGWAELLLFGHEAVVPAAGTHLVLPYLSIDSASAKKPGEMLPRASHVLEVPPCL